MSQRMCHGGSARCLGLGDIAYIIVTIFSVGALGWLMPTTGRAGEEQGIAPPPPVAGDGHNPDHPKGKTAAEKKKAQEEDEKDNDPNLFLAASPPPNPEIDVLIARAQEFAEAERYETALALLQKVIQDSSGTMGSSDGRVFVPARTLAERMLAALPKKALDLYRLTATPLASSYLESWEREHDPKALQRVVDDLFLSSVGDDAAFLLGSYHLDRYEFAAARILFRKILDLHPDPSVSRQAVMARLAFAHSRLGDAAGARAIWQEMVEGEGGEDALARWAAVRKEIDTQTPKTITKNPHEKPTDWLMTLGNPQRTGRMPTMPDLRKNTALAMYWEKKFSVPFSNNNQSRRGARITIINGRVVQKGRKSSKGNDPEMLKKAISRWKKGGWQPTDQVVIQNGRLYYSGRSSLYCLDAETGKEIWHSAAPQSQKNQGRQNYYVNRGGGGGKRPTSQGDVWAFGSRLAHALGIVGGGVYRIEDQAVYTMRYYGGWRNQQIQGNALAAYDAKSGERLWRIGKTKDANSPFFGLRFVAAPVLCAGRLLVPAEGDSGSDKGLSLLAIDPKDGSLLWKRFLCIYTPNRNSSWYPVDITVAGMDAYVVTGQGLVLSVDGYTGDVRWASKYSRIPENFGNRNRRVLINGRWQVAPKKNERQGWQENVAFLAGTRLWVLASDMDQFLVFDRATGVLENTFPKGDYIYPVGVVDHDLIVAGRTGAARYDLNTMKSLWETKTESLLGRGMMTKSRVYLSAADAIVPLDLATGKADAAMPVHREKPIPLGNLYADGERLILAGMDRVRVVMNPDAQLLVLDKAVQADPSAANLASRGHFLHVLKQADKALPDLRKAYALANNEKEREPLVAALTRAVAEYDRLAAEEERFAEALKTTATAIYKKFENTPMPEEGAAKETWRASFKPEDLQAQWQKDRGEIAIEDGALKLWTKPRRAGQQPHRTNQIVWVKGKTFAGSFQVRFTGWQKKVWLCDVTLFLQFPRPGGGKPHRIEVQFGANGNVRNLLNSDRKTYARSTDYLMQQEKKHKVVVTRVAGRVVMVVDGKPVLDGIVPELQAYNGPIQLGLYGWGYTHYFSDLRVTELPASFQTALAELDEPRQKLAAAKPKTVAAQAVMKAAKGKLAVASSGQRQIGTVTLAKLQDELLGSLLRQAKTAGEGGRALLVEALRVAPLGNEKARVRYLLTQHSMKYGSLDEAIATLPDLSAELSRLARVGETKDDTSEIAPALLYQRFCRELVTKHGAAGKAKLVASAQAKIKKILAEKSPSIPALHSWATALLDSPIGLEAGQAAIDILRQQKDMPRVVAFYHLLTTSHNTDTAAWAYLHMAAYLAENKQPRRARLVYQDAIQALGDKSVVIDQQAARLLRDIAAAGLTSIKPTPPPKKTSKPVALGGLLWIRQEAMSINARQRGYATFWPQASTVLFPYDYRSSRLRAFEPRTNKKHWSISVKNLVPNGRLRTVPPMQARVAPVLLLHLVSRLVLLDSRTGKAIWKWNAGGQIQARAYRIVGDKVALWVMRRNQRVLTVLSATTGRVVWQRNLGENPRNRYYGNIPIPIAGNYLMMVANQRAGRGALLCAVFDVNTGKKVSSFSASGRIVASSASGFLSVARDAVRRYTLPAGKVDWEHSLRLGQDWASPLPANRIFIYRSGKGAELIDATTGKRVMFTPVDLGKAAYPQVEYVPKRHELIVSMGQQNQEKRVAVMDTRAGKMVHEFKLPKEWMWNSTFGTTRDHLLVMRRMDYRKRRELQKKGADKKKAYLAQQYQLVRKKDGVFEPGTLMPREEDVKAYKGFLSFQAKRFGDLLMLSYGYRKIWAYSLVPPTSKTAAVTPPEKKQPPKEAE